MTTIESYSLRDILRVFFSHKAYFIVLPIVLTISAYIGGELRTPVYEASVKMFIKAQKKTEAEFYTGIHSGDIITEHLELVRSNPVLRLVVEALQLYERPIDYEKKFASPLKRAFIDFRLEKVRAQPTKENRITNAMGQLSSNIMVNPIRSSSLFFITVSDFDPAVAVKIANSLSRSYVIFDLQQQIEEIKLKYGEKHATVLQLNAYIEEFSNTLHGGLIPDMEALGPASIKIVAQAEGAAMRRGFSTYTLMLLSFFTGIVLAISFAVVTEYLNTTINSSQDIVEYFNLSFLGSTPKRNSKNKGLISTTNPEITTYVKSIHNLADQLSLLKSDKKIKTILFTDVEGAEATTTICVNVAMNLANKTGKRVLLIDADFSTSSLPHILRISNNIGLADILQKDGSIMDAVQNIESNVSVLLSGKTDLNPSMLLNNPNMSKVIDNVKEVYDFIFINCPGLKVFTDSYILSFVADGTILVVNEGKVRRQIFDNAIAPLRQEKVNILGVILSNRHYVIPDFIYKLT